MAKTIPNRKTQDIGNIVFMEHVNLTVPDQETATTFYVEGLGMTRDPYMMVGTNNMWINVGQQQFHLPRGEPQHFRGHIGLVVPNLEALLGRLQSVEPKLDHTQFAYQKKSTHVAVTGPWGNQFKVYQANNGFPGSRGIPYVEMRIPAGTAQDIAAFYQDCMHAPAQVKKGRSSQAETWVCAGPGQHLVFRETAEDLEPYDGHHLAVYVADFSGPHSQLKKHKLISSEDNEFQYRFQEIVPPGKRKPVFTIEHEVRSLYHPLYRSPLVNRTGSERLP